jgi:hypothetical protein
MPALSERAPLARGLTAGSLKHTPKAPLCHFAKAPNLSKAAGTSCCLTSKTWLRRLVMPEKAVISNFYLWPSACGRTIPDIEKNTLRLSHVTVYHLFRTRLPDPSMRLGCNCSCLFEPRPHILGCAENYCQGTAHSTDLELRLSGHDPQEYGRHLDLGRR